MNPKGNVWGFFGTRNTGKTYEALQLSLDFRVGAFKNNPKRIIVFDHSNNSSYKEITKVVTFEDLERPMPKMQWLSFNLMIMTSFRTTVAIISKMRWSSTTMQVHSLVLER
jgi:hypothetical protein